MTRRVLVTGSVLCCVAIAGACWFARGASADVPTAKAERGAFVDAVQIRGEIKAARSVIIIAPADAGELRIVKLARSGTVVKKGDVLIEFDGSTVSRTLEEKQSEVRGFDAEIERAHSEGRSKEEENLTAETKAQYDVERAKLDYSAKEILPRVDAEQRRLKVDDAGHKLREASANLDTGRVAATAKESGIDTKRTKSQFDLDKAHRQLNSLSVSAPSDGIVTILRNWRSGNWMNPQEFKEGDRVWAGASIAELPDISSMYASARVDEVERGRIAIGQGGTIRVEAIPDRELKGQVDKVSALAKADFTTWPPPRNFDLTMTINDREDRLRPGMTATIRVAVETVSNALLVPPQAIFPTGGEDVVYVMRHGTAERRVVEIDRRNADHVVIKSGLHEGEAVALKDPTVQEARR